MENEILLQILSELKEVKSELKEVKERVSSVEERLVSVEERQILFENGYSQDRKALFDGYALLYGICEEIRDEIRRINAHQDKQDVHLMLLDEKTRSNSDVV